jgi:hypothetical protein
MLCGVGYDIECGTVCSQQPQRVLSSSACIYDQRFRPELGIERETKLLDRLRASMISMQASAGASVRLLKLTIFSSRAIGTARTFETLSEAN